MYKISLYLNIDWMNFGDVSVFIVDWSKIANKEYHMRTSRYGSEEVARNVADFILCIIQDVLNITDPEEQRIFSAKIRLAGHSLGAHISGWIGHFILSAINTLIGIIFGLDPAGPNFRTQLTDCLQFRLNQKNAIFVQVMHTDNSGCGNKHSLGHADYFFNRGDCQPGCICGSLPGAQNCNHVRAIYYFRASLYVMVIGQHLDVGVDNIVYHTDIIDYFGIHTLRIPGLFYVEVPSNEPPFFKNDANVVKAGAGNIGKLRRNTNMITLNRITGRYLEFYPSSKMEKIGTIVQDELIN